jgi:hypothetical protein
MATHSPTITDFLWYDHEAEETAKFMPLSFLRVPSAPLPVPTPHLAPPLDLMRVEATSLLLLRRLPLQQPR